MKRMKILVIAVLLSLLISGCKPKEKADIPEQIGQNPDNQKSSGGTTFYDKGEYTDGWRYMEVAPVSSEFSAPWGLQGIDCPGTLTDLGAGRANTAIIIALLNANDETGRAAQLCANLFIDDLNDWFLPSKDELNQIYMYEKDTGNIGEYKNIYWSSSANSEDPKYSTWFQQFSDGYQDTNYHFGRNDEAFVRAVRAF